MNLHDQSIYSYFLNDLLFYLNGHLDYIRFAHKMLCFDQGHLDALSKDEYERIMAVQSALEYVTSVVYEWNPNFHLFIVLTMDPRRVADNLLRALKRNGTPLDGQVFNAFSFVRSQNFLFDRLVCVLPPNKATVLYVGDYLDPEWFYRQLCAFDKTERAGHVRE